jgi:[protein-PII] uridylyltransferase
MRGRNVVRHLTALVDDVVRTIFQYAIHQHGESDTSCTLLALGGYGRGELNPYSDIDLMFLCHKTPPDTVIRETLYLLWDVGYTLGHSVRTRRDSVKMADADLSAQTAMLEARFVEGDPALFQWFQEELGHRRFTQRRRQSFVRQKLAESAQRHAAFANTVNLMEPNVKESPGGLRDYHLALWLGMAMYDAPSVERLVQEGLLSEANQEDIDLALDFLFMVRNALHYHHGRKNDLLSVDVQEKLAAELHFEADAQKLAVEHFLKAYYVHANTIFALGLTLQEAAKHAHQSRFWQFFRRPKAVAEGFEIVNGYLSHTSESWPELFASKPLLLLSAFAIAQAHEVPLAPELSRMIQHLVPLFDTDAIRTSPEAKELFFNILAQPHAAPTLRALHRHGLLAAYLPEFAPLTCLVQFDLYHRYTVEEHTFHCIEALESLPETGDPALKRLVGLYRQIPDKALLIFALLLHDLGKDVGPGHASHVYRSGELAEPICERLGLNATQRHTIQILVVNHLVMNHLAQRRDIADVKVIADFAEVVETVQLLDQLYLLTFADTSGVGPGVWTAWKGALLAELHQRTRDYLLGQTDDLAPSNAELRRQLRPDILTELGPSANASQLDGFLDAMPARYLRLTPPVQIAKHVTLTQPQLRSPVVLYTAPDAVASFTHVTICAATRRGLFSLIAGTLSRHNLNILGAQIYTSKEGVAIDTLQVETLDHIPPTHDHMWQQIEADLQAAMAGTLALETAAGTPRPMMNSRAFRTFAQPPQVTLDNTSSDTHTIIEVRAQDSLGLLYTLTRVLYDQGLDIALAKISTEANRAIDVFYVRTAEGKKLLDAETTRVLQDSLLSALE